jgi:peroxiredoxin
MNRKYRLLACALLLIAVAVTACVPAAAVVPTKPAVTASETRTPIPTETPIAVVLPDKWTQTPSRTQTPGLPTQTPTLFVPTVTRTSTSTYTVTLTRVVNQAPDFSALTLSGEDFTLSKQIGSPVLLFFATSTNTSCQKMAVLLVAANKKYPSVKMILIDENDTLTLLNNFIKKYAIPFPAMIDNKSAVYKKFRMDTTPSTVYINAYGSIVETLAGEITKEQLNASLDKITK